MRDINCRVFQAQVADWKADRLSREQAQRMAEHLNRCGECAREARAEMQMREIWRTAPSAPPQTDLWTQIAGRLEPEPSSGRRAFALTFAPRWTLAGSVALAVLTVCCLWAGPKEASRTASEFSPALHAAPLAPVRDASWTVLPDVSHVDPSVDDPVGATTERVWGLVNARRASDP